LAILQQALLDYRRAFNRLPCPADASMGIDSAAFGVEAFTAIDMPDCLSGSPAANFSDGSIVAGMIPTKTLQLPDDYAFDAWGRRIMYAVDNRLSARYSHTDAFTNVPITEATSRIAVMGPPPTIRTTEAVYALLSFGANGHGAFPRPGGSSRLNVGSINSEELANCSCQSDGTPQPFAALFVQQASTDSPSDINNAFDDIVVFASRNTLK
jgi:hypothetical protein